MEANNDEVMGWRERDEELAVGVKPDKRKSLFWKKRILTISYY